jgi:hypothetical protein
MAIDATDVCGSGRNISIEFVEPPAVDFVAQQQATECSQLAHGCRRVKDCRMKVANDSFDPS